MREDQVLSADAQVGSSTITIELPSITITKSPNGYEFMMRNDQINRHLANCQDLWDVTDNILHHFRLTPQLLTEIYSFRKTCAELKWDDAGIAAHFAEIARAKEAARAAQAKAQPGFV